MPKSKCSCTWNDDEFCEFHEHLDSIYKNIIKSKKLKAIGEGCSRRVYSNKKSKWVYKFPFNSAGIRHNYTEALAYKHRHVVTNWQNKPVGQYLAKCTLLKNNVLRMEKLQIPDDDGAIMEDLEEIDSNQGGLDSNNSWKIYDYSLAIKIKGKKIDEPDNFESRPGERLPKIKGINS